MKLTLLLRLLAGTAALLNMGAWAQSQGADGVSWQAVSHPLLLWGITLGLVILAFALVGAWRARSGRNTTTKGLGGLMWVAFTLLVALGVPLWDTLTHEPKEAADLQVTCTASQWKWHFDYTTYQGKALAGPAFVSAMKMPPTIDSQALAQQLFGSGQLATNTDELLEVDHPMVLPAGQRVRFSITSEDSVHAWWIPALNIKKEAIPGFVQTVELQLPAQTGHFHGMCSQMCGQDHAFMPIVVKLVPPAEFEGWLARKQAALAQSAQRPIPSTLETADLLRQGEILYRERCAVCHLPEGEGASPRIPKLAESPVVAGAEAPLIELLYHGRNVMPGMRDVLARDELAALTTYVRARWGNLSPTEATVQPAQLPKSF